MAALIMSVRDRVHEPGRVGRGVMEELGVCRRGARWRSWASVAGGEEARRVSLRKKMSCIAVVGEEAVVCVARDEEGTFPDSRQGASVMYIRMATRSWFRRRLLEINHACVSCACVSLYSCSFLYVGCSRGC
jgi:hypothetical protein